MGGGGAGGVCASDHPAESEHGVVLEEGLAEDAEEGDGTGYQEASIGGQHCGSLKILQSVYLE